MGIVKNVNSDTGNDITITPSKLVEEKTQYNVKKISYFIFATNRQNCVNHQCQNLFLCKLHVNFID